jgi:hypothetical protein
MWVDDGAANDTLSWNHGLPMESYIIQEDVQLGPNSHLSYNEGIVTGQNHVSKNGGYGFEGHSFEPFSTKGSLQRHISIFNGSELDTNASSCSPKSLFSNQSDSDHAIGPGEMAKDASTSNGWAVFEPVSPSEIKESQTPYHGHLSPASFDLRQNHPVYFKGLGIMSSIHQTPNSVSWPAHFSAQSSGCPYFPRGSAPTSSFQQSTTDSLTSHSTHALPNVSYYSYGSDSHGGASVQDHYQASTMAETQAQRKEEDLLLIEGKAQGLTYKQIREKMHVQVAESTLRGRYRSLLKPRQERVRKPVWKEKDVSDASSISQIVEC